MHVEIDADCRRGLRIIEEIPDLRPCKLEGYNGIGKTSAIRLLQICTGEQPFEGNKAAWRSFREQLIRAKVRVTGLREVQEIEWTLHPNQWPTEEAEPLRDDVGAIFIDKRRATISDVKELLTVHHLNATETPVNILSDRAAAAGSTLENWYSSHGEPREKALDTVLGDLLRAISATPPGAVRLSREVAQAARITAIEVTTRTEESRNRVHLLTRAVEIASQLDLVRGSSPQMQHRLRELENQLGAVDAERETLNQNIEAAQVQRHLSQQIEERIERYEKLIRRHDNALRRGTARLEQAAAAAGVRPSPRSIAQKIDSVEQELAALVDEQPGVVEGPRLIAVLNDLVRRLDEAVSLELADSILIDRGDAQPGWTVAGLRDVFASQIHRLTERGHAADAEQLGKRISAARRRLDDLALVESLLESLAQTEARLKSAEDKLMEATAELPGDISRELNELITKRNELDKEGRDLQSRIDRLRAELALLGGGKTEEALAAELDHICREVDVAPSRVRGTLERERVRLNDLSQEEAIAQARDASAARELDEKTAAVDAVVNHLTSDESLSWLKRAMPRIAELQHLELDEKLGVLEMLQELLNDERELISSSVSAVRGIGAAMDELASRLRNPSAGDERRPQTWTLPVRQWLAREVQQWFDDEIIRNALFGGGEGVHLNPEQLAVSWTLDGERFERPLGYFSSGEQAFAFTRARVAQLERDTDRAANRLIALDEFGAFLDADRFAELSQYLVQRQARMPHDHILVILPCRVTPQSTSTGGRPPTGRDSELARRGYFAEALRA